MTGIIVTGLLGTVASLVLLALLQRERARRHEADDTAGRYLEQIEELAQGLAAEQAKALRLEDVIATKKRELAQLAGELDACTDPAVARAAARRLLLDAWSGDRPGPG